MIMKLIEIMIQKHYFYLIMYILSARFQLENLSAPAWLGSARAEKFQPGIITTSLLGCNIELLTLV